MNKRDTIEEWIWEYLKENISADIYNQHFHDAFSDEFGGSLTLNGYGNTYSKKAMSYLKSMCNGFLIKKHKSTVWNGSRNQSITVYNI